MQYESDRLESQMDPNDFPGCNIEVELHKK
jgi:hypothetical protein